MLSQEKNLEESVQVLDQVLDENVHFVEIDKIDIKFEPKLPYVNKF